MYLHNVKPISSVSDLEKASKNDMIAWIVENDKIGSVLTKQGYCSWDIGSTFRKMNKDFLATIIKAVM